MARKKETKQSLIKFDICYIYNGIDPNIYEIDNEGRFLSRPHVEVKKLYNHPGKKVFKTEIKKAGLYKFKNLPIPKSDKLYSVFGEARNGIFLLKDNREVFLIEVTK